VSEVTRRARTEPLPARLLRQGVLGVLLFGSLGTLAELYLIGHYEDRSQIAPLVLLVAVVLGVAAFMLRPGEALRRAMIVIMIVSAISGVVGHWLHFDGNAEFEREMYPDRAGMELFRESMSGATPVLAPGTMTVIGLLGLVALWRPRER